MGMHTRHWPLASAGFFLAAVAAAGAASAAGGHTLAVGATVLSNSNCRFSNAGPTALAFGAIDPSGTGNRTATAAVGFRCGGSVAVAVYSVSSDDGLYESGANAPRMRHATDLTRFLPYSLDLPQSGSVPRNVNQTLTVTATVLTADYQNALAGAYADTVILTIVP